MYKKIILLLFLVITFSSFAQYPSINLGRPRIYADTNRISWMQGNYNITGNYKTDFDNFVLAYTNNWINDPQLYLLGSNQSLWTWNWNSEWAKDEGFFTIYLYKVSGDALALERCKFIAQQTINSINTANFATMPFYEKEAFLRKTSEVGGLLLDWCYDDLPITLRNQLVQALYLMNVEFMNTYILNDNGTAYVSGHNTWNVIICNQNALVLNNASGLTPSQQATIVYWYQTIYDKLINEFIPCWTYYRDDDGGWNWGGAYSMWSLTDQFQLFENMRIATNKNFYQDLNWVQNSINQYIYFMQPNNKCLHLGDGQMMFEGGDKVMYLHSRYFNDARSNWLAQYWSQPANIGWTRPLFDKLFYRDYTAVATTQPTNPLDWFSDKVGLSVSRSSWNNNATMVAFFNSPSKRAGHEHRDNNSFTIFKNTPLLIDSGYYNTYGESHYLNYYERTIAHNSICVFDTTENYSSQGQAVSNDGGQIESVVLQNLTDILNPSNKRGEWIQNAVGTNYQYNISDAQQSYNPAKVDFFRRRLLYLKPNEIIVLDNVHLNNVAIAQRDISWVAHFVNEPTINGTITNTQIVNHITTHNGTDYTSVNGNGNVAIRTLLPENSNTKKIGGNGYEYWVNGVNYAPNTTPNTSFYSPGSWRIEVRPDAIPTDGNVTYLHTINVGDNSTPSVSGGIALQNTTSVGTDWNNTVYFFPADGLLNKSYHYFNNISGGRTIGIFATDLIQGTYIIKIDNVDFSSINTDTNGILQTNISLPGGNHTVEIINSSLSINHNSDDVILIYPNPTKSEIFLKGTRFSQKNHIEIYNLNGQLTLEFYNKQLVDVSDLQKGTYIIKIRVDNIIHEVKFIKE